MSEYGLCVRALYSELTDEELDTIVRKIKDVFPNCGYRLLQGHLLRQGYRVPQMQVRHSLHRVDGGVAISWASFVQRRKYSVQSPLSLLHVDGNHKLIR